MCYTLVLRRTAEGEELRNYLVFAMGLGTAEFSKLSGAVNQVRSGSAVVHFWCWFCVSQMSVHEELLVATWGFVKYR